MSEKKPKTQDKIIKEIIEQSGHDFHLRVSLFLQNNGWIVTNNPHYSDPVTNINREIDIIATKEYETGGKYNAWIYLYIECKYILHETVIWTVERNESRTTNLIKKDFSSETMHIFYDNSNITHHYSTYQKVAKVHESNDKNKNFEKAINQVLNGFIYFDNLIELSRKSLTLRYPIILVNSFDKLFERINPGDNSKKQYRQIEDNFLYEVDYINNTVPEYYLIDIVCFDKLKQYIEDVEKNDLEKLKNCLLEGWEEQSFQTRMIQKRKRGNPGR